MVKTTGRWKSEGKLSEWLRDNARPTDRLIPHRLVKGCRAGRFVGDERGENIELLRLACDRFPSARHYVMRQGLVKGCRTGATALEERMR